MSMMDENLHHCVLEKSRKIARHRAKYSEWWLIMPDHIGYTLDELERDLFLEQLAVPHGAFNRIILLDPRDVSRSIDIAAG